MHPEQHRPGPMAVKARRAKAGVSCKQQWRLGKCEGAGGRQKGTWDLGRVVWRLARIETGGKARLQPRNPQARPRPRRPTPTTSRLLVCLFYRLPLGGTRPFSLGDEWIPAPSPSMLPSCSVHPSIHPSIHQSINPPAPPPNNPTCLPTYHLPGLPACLPPGHTYYFIPGQRAWTEAHRQPDPMPSRRSISSSSPTAVNEPAPWLPYPPTSPNCPTASHPELPASVPACPPPGRAPSWPSRPVPSPIPHEALWRASSAPDSSTTDPARHEPHPSRCPPDRPVPGPLHPL